MAESALDFLAREYEYVRGREGAEFFLAIERYTAALTDNRRIRRALDRLRNQMDASLKTYVAEQNALVEEAKKIRNALAERAPEIDNSDMERPDPRSHYYAKWKYDSFAGFDNLVARDAILQIGYPTVPGRDDDPGVVSTLLGILRGRHRAAVFGEGAGINAEEIRDDLGDLNRRIANLGSHYEHVLRRFRQEARTLPGLAFARLVYFGADLNPEPPVLDTEDDLERLFDKTLREWGAPKTLVRQLVNGDAMEQWERTSVGETEEFLKTELDRLHQELVRRLGEGPGAAVRFLRDEWVIALGSAIVGGVIVGIILYFALGDNHTSPPPSTTTIRTTVP